MNENYIFKIFIIILFIILIFFYFGEKYENYTSTSASASANNGFINCDKFNKKLGENYYDTDDYDTSDYVIYDEIYKPFGFLGKDDVFYDDLFIGYHDEQ